MARVPSILRPLAALVLALACTWAAAQPADFDPDRGDRPRQRPQREGRREVDSSRTANDQLPVLLAVQIEQPPPAHDGGVQLERP
ncbi:MAG: hypothetical protein KJ018_05330, partial [Burkholderiales bacterium]|nr:hypothetical protein [Burkholderiales bacterium]